MNELEKLFAKKQTENGDDAFNTTGDNKLLDIFFMTSYFEKHLSEVKIGDSDYEKLFAMFIRDARFGIGRRDLGRELMKQAKVRPQDIVFAGRFDDLIYNPNHANLTYLKEQVYCKNELAKKWCPRLTSKNKEVAKLLCEYWEITPKQYRKLIKCDTTENKLSHHRIDDINFEQVPSLAMIKYFNRFSSEKRFAEYLESVKKGDKKLNVATTTVYDIYRNRGSINANLFFDKLEKISINCIPVLDTSGSMADGVDSIGKATSIAHYLSKCSTFCNGHVVSFSSRPQLIKMRGDYYGETRSLYTGDCSNTDFGAVMKLFAGLNEVPEYLVVLSDMEFDEGSIMNKERTMQLFKEKGFKTKIIWWNFNSRNKTVPELDEYGNIFISGYSPYMLKYMESGFDGNKFLDKLLKEYSKKIRKE